MSLTSLNRPLISEPRNTAAAIATTAMNAAMSAYWVMVTPSSSCANRPWYRVQRRTMFSPCVEPHRTVEALVHNGHRPPDLIESQVARRKQDKLPVPSLRALLGAVGSDPFAPFLARRVRDCLRLCSVAILAPPSGDLSRFVSEGLWLCCTRQRRILSVSSKEAPLCGLIS